VRSSCVAPVVVIGCTDKRIRIFTRSSGQLQHSLSLEGHEDWVRCLNITTFPSATPGGPDDLVLASGSQDNYIRLWRIAATPTTTGERSEEDTQAATTGGGLDMLDEFERKLAGEAGGSGSVQISTKAHLLSIEDGDM
jgi:elongator complex protein 2